MSQNVADENQVRQSQLNAKDLRRQELSDLRVVLSTVEGRRFLARFLFDMAGIDTDAWEGNARIHFNVAQQTFGKVIKREIEEADFAMWQLLEAEEWKRKKETSNA